MSEKGQHCFQAVLRVSELLGGGMRGLIRFRYEDSVFSCVANLGRVHVLGQSVGEL